MSGRPRVWRARRHVLTSVIVLASGIGCGAHEGGLSAGQLCAEIQSNRLPDVGAERDSDQATRDYDDPLACAMRGGNVRVLKRLFAAGFDANRYLKGWVPPADTFRASDRIAGSAEARQRFVEAIRVSIENGLDPCLPRPSNWTANGDPVFVEHAEDGSDIVGETTYTIVVRRGEEPVGEVFREAGADCTTPRVPTRWR